MLIGQARGVGRKTRQEVEMMQKEQENSGKEEVDSSAIPSQTTEEATTCELTAERGTKPYDSHRVEL